MAHYMICGAHGGVGEALTRKLAAKSGSELLITARDPHNLSDLAAECKAKTVAFDVLSDQPAPVAEGPLKGLAYAIGSIDLKPFHKAGLEDFRACLELNVIGAIKALQANREQLKAGQGSVVLFSSIAATQGFQNHAVIATAKAALEGLTVSLAAEWAPSIRVNAVAPSLTDTSIAKPLTGAAPMAKAIADMHPLPRLGQPDDIAGAAAYLLGEESDWVTGQVLHVDGGRSTLRPKG